MENGLEKLREEMARGRVFRREQLVGCSNSVDRHLRYLVKKGEARKLQGGLYYRPEKSTFGDVPAEPEQVLKAFLKGNDFLLVSLNDYNGLGVGTTQLYNEYVVYNHKRDGHMMLENQRYYFIKNRPYPKEACEAFLYVDLMNNLRLLAEDTLALKEKLAQKVLSLGLDDVRKFAQEYGNAATRKFFDGLTESQLSY